MNTPSKSPAPSDSAPDSTPGGPPVRHTAGQASGHPAPSLKFRAAVPDTEAISLSEAAVRMGVSRDEVIECVRRGKLTTTTRMDEICVLWPREAGDARENAITTDAFADPKHSEDPRWLHAAIGIAMMGLFLVAAIYLLVTITTSFLKPAGSL